MTNTSFDTINFDHTTVLEKDGIRIKGFIVGVNSGMYQLPYVIQVSVWTRKWFFKKFFYKEMKLNIFEVRKLKEECEKVIDYYKDNLNNK